MTASLSDSGDDDWSTRLVANLSSIFCTAAIMIAETTWLIR